MSAKWRHCVSCPTTVCSTRFNSTEWPTTLPLTLSLQMVSQSFQYIIRFSRNSLLVQIGQINNGRRIDSYFRNSYSYEYYRNRNKNESLIGATILQEKNIRNWIIVRVLNKDNSRKEEICFLSLFLFFLSEQRQISRVPRVFYDGNLLRIRATHLWNEVYTSTGRPERNAWCMVGVKRA